MISNTVVTFIYYKDDQGNRIPILVDSGVRKTSLQTYITDSYVKKIQSEFPKSKNNLYVLIDGVEFKLA